MKSTFVQKAYIKLSFLIPLFGSVQAKEQIAVESCSPLPLHFFKPLNYSQRSLTEFLTNVYNDERYAQDLLALNFCHPISGLKLAANSKQPRQFARKMIRLFDPKIHHGIFFNPYAFSAFLEQSRDLLSPLCNLKKERAASVVRVKNCIGHALITHFKQLKLNPDLTLTELSEQVIEALESDDRDCSVRDLQHAIHHFLSQVTSCLIWDPAEDGSWELMKTIASQLATFADKELLTHDMLDDVLWALTHKVAYYLLLAPQDVPSKVYDQMSSDLASLDSPLWTTAEREVHIRTKREHLIQAVMRGQVWSQAHSLGYVLPT
jgi:hypothetical protein